MYFCLLIVLSAIGCFNSAVSLATSKDVALMWAQNLAKGLCYFFARILRMNPMTECFQTLNPRLQHVSKRSKSPPPLKCGQVPLIQVFAVLTAKSQHAHSPKLIIHFHIPIVIIRITQNTFSQEHLPHSPIPRASEHWHATTATLLPQLQPTNLARKISETKSLFRCSGMKEAVGEAEHCLMLLSGQSGRELCGCRHVSRSNQMVSATVILFVLFLQCYVFCW